MVLYLITSHARINWISLGLENRVRTMHIVLKTIFCERTGGEGTTEEPYLTIRDSEGNEERWGPEHMKTGTGIQLDRHYDIESDGYIDLILRESDTLGMGTGGILDDDIDTVRIRGNQERGSYNAAFGVELGGDRQMYRVFYDVKDHSNQALRRYILHLDTLECGWNTWEADDRVFITLDGVRVWGPHSIEINQTLDINLNPIVTAPVWIQMWEHDKVGRHDLLGTHIIEINDDFDFTVSYDADFVNEYTPGRSAFTYSYRLNYTIRRLLLQDLARFFPGEPHLGIADDDLLRLRPEDD